MKILYKLTTRSRPDKMFKCIENIRAMALEKDPWIQLTLDINDNTLNTKEMRAKMLSYPNVFPLWGISRNKIDAFNRDVPQEGWDIIVATSDDIKFSHGFDEQIKKDAIEAAEKQPADWSGITDVSDYDFVLWYSDGAEHGKILTVPIMTMKYYKRLGYIYNPIYQNLFCDEEAIYVGEKLGKIYYSEAKILEHLHPAWGKAEWDDQYRRTDSTYHIEKQIFLNRKKMGFPI